MQRGRLARFLLATAAACSPATPTPTQVQPGPPADASTLADAATPTPTTDAAPDAVTAATTGTSDAGVGASGPDAATTPAATKRIFVREKLAACEGGEGPKKCLQIRESESAPWTLFYSSIEGFSYEESYKYELRVAVESRPNAPADASTKRYRLVEIISKKKAR